MKTVIKSIALFYTFSMGYDGGGRCEAIHRARADWHGKRASVSSSAL